ncbi:M20 family metallopeptidase [Paenisporosarcina macmurdoensis]|uniref:Peptidase M20 domain-containing protein 2 n=1 Tax=Paenisporosarcina macmurdoensis TaxID=212659 RepID=A0ABW1L1R5_9BACL
MTLVIDSKSRIYESIDSHAERLISLAKEIHAKPEIGNEEVFASYSLSEYLREFGFEVTLSVAGHDTAFYAVKDSGVEGPTIAFLAEYDALPGLGHACGHNIIGTTSVAAGIALSEVLFETGGKVIVLGTPAEEGGPNGSAKGSFVRHGLLENVDVALMIHPSGRTSLTSPTLAVDPLDFHFYGTAAHASGSPEKGINALDSVIQLFNGINALRQHVTSDVRIHGIITHGGDAPNIVPDYASARFYIRADTWAKTEAVSTRIRAIAEGAALSTGATVKVERFQNEVQDFVLNNVLDSVLHEELESHGEVVFSKRSRGLGSTDAGNISYVVPTAHPYIKIGPDELIAHTNEFREAANSDVGYKALVTGAKTLAGAGYRLLSEPALLHQVRKAHEVALKAKDEK